MVRKIGVDLGGTHLRVGIVENGKVLKYIKKETPKTEKELLAEMVKSISECMTDDVVGIGIASPGPLKDGVIYNTPNLPFEHFNLEKFIRDKFRKKTKVANDANCVALAEAKLGVRKQNFLVMTLGTGIGGGIVIKGELYNGSGYAGELGHMVVCNGKYLETLWQENRKRMKELFGEKAVVKDLFKARDEKASKLLEGIYTYLGEALGSYTNIFSPEVIVLMGGIRETGNKFIRGVSKVARKYSILPAMPKIQWSKLDHPGILGASLLIE